MQGPSIDGWAHCGIRRFRPIEEVLQFLDAVGIGRAVIVQPLGDDDNDYLLEVAARHRDRVRPVGVVAVGSADRKRQLGRLAEGGGVGVRVTSVDLAADPRFASEASAAGLAIAVHAPDGVAALVPMAGMLRELERPLIIAHVGMPTVVDGKLDRGADILELATIPTVHVLVSGLAMACPYPYRPLQGLVRDVVSAFGPERVIWGSNYPLVDAAETARDLELLRSPAFGLTAPETAAITSETIRRLWFVSSLAEQ